LPYAHHYSHRPAAVCVHATPNAQRYTTRHGRDAIVATKQVRLSESMRVCRRLMFHREFASNYTSFDSTGARFITEQTNIKLVGIDYLSIGCLEDIVETHRVLLGKVSHLQPVLVTPELVGLVDMVVVGCWVGCWSVGGVLTYDKWVLMGRVWGRTQSPGTEAGRRLSHQVGNALH